MRRAVDRAVAVGNCRKSDALGRNPHAHQKFLNGLRVLSHRKMFSLQRTCHPRGCKFVFSVSLSTYSLHAPKFLFFQTHVFLYVSYSWVS